MTNQLNDNKEKKYNTHEDIERMMIEQEEQELAEKKRQELLNPPPALPSDRINLQDPKAVRESILDQLKIKAINGDLSAIKEYNRLYLPSKGMESFVRFELPEGFNTLDSNGLSLMLRELLSAVGKGLMSIEQFKELSTSIKSMVDITEISELAERIESIETTDSTDDFDDDDSIILLEDYQNREDLTDEQKEKFHKTPVNAVLLGKQASEFNRGRHGNEQTPDEQTPDENN